MALTQVPIELSSTPGIVDNSNATAITIDSSENVGIGTSSPDALLHLSANNPTFKVTDSSTSGSVLVNPDYFSGGTDHIRTDTNNLAIGTDAANKYLMFKTASQERMRIDSSGNLLVSQSTADSTSNGHGLLATGRAYHTMSSAHPLQLNRKSNDGDITVFQKDGTTVGSIGTNSSRLTIGSGDTGLLIAGDLDNITPFNTSTNASRDAAVDLGNSGVRFKDLYLSGGAYLGGTVAANKLDDYEEGTWTPTDASGAGLTLSINAASYTKIGNLCYISAYINYPSNSSTATQILGGLPFVTRSGNTYAQLTVRAVNNTVSARNLTFQTTNNSFGGSIHDGLAPIENDDLSGIAILISGVYETA